MRRFVCACCVPHFGTWETFGISSRHRHHSIGRGRLTLGQPRSGASPRRAALATSAEVASDSVRKRPACARGAVASIAAAGHTCTRARSRRRTPRRSCMPNSALLWREHARARHTGGRVATLQPRGDATPAVILHKPPSPCAGGGSDGSAEQCPLTRRHGGSSAARWHSRKLRGRWRAALARVLSDGCRTRAKADVRSTREWSWCRSRELSGYRAC